MKEHDDRAYYRSTLEREKQRLTELEERGIAALSDYDVTIAFGGDAERALATAKQLVGNHIAYFGEKAARLDPEVRQLDLFAPHGDIYVAPEPAPDEHLESAYDDRQGDDGEEDVGDSEAEDGRWDK